MNSRFARGLRLMSEHEIGRPRFPMRLKNIVQGQLDARVQPTYDYFEVALNSAVRQEVLFTIPQGQQYTPAGGAAIFKTPYHTSMVTAGALDAPKKLLVKNVSIMPRPDIHPSDLNALIGQYLVTFNTLGKDFWVGHAQKLPGGAGGFISFGGTLTAPNLLSSCANGWPSGQNVAPVTDDVPDIPGYPPITPITGVLLEQQQPFKVVVDPTLTQAAAYTTNNSLPAGTVGTGIKAWCYLEGIFLVAIV